MREAPSLSNPSHDVSRYQKRSFSQLELEEREALKKQRKGEERERSKVVDGTVDIMSCDFYEALLSSCSEVVEIVTVLQHVGKRLFCASSSLQPSPFLLLLAPTDQAAMDIHLHLQPLIPFPCQVVSDFVPGRVERVGGFLICSPTSKETLQRLFFPDPSSRAPETIGRVRKTVLGTISHVFAADLFLFSSSDSSSLLPYSSLIMVYLESFHF